MKQNLKKWLNTILILIAVTILGVSFYVTRRKTIQLDETRQDGEVSILEEEREQGVVEEDQPVQEEKQRIHRMDGEILQEKDRQLSTASWYDRRVCGETYGTEACKTASGEVFDEEALTMACESNIRFGTVLELCYVDKCISIRCNDRGNFARLGRKFDLSRGAFSRLADLEEGIIEVMWEVK